MAAGIRKGQIQEIQEAQENPEISQAAAEEQSAIDEEHENHLVANLEFYTVEELTTDVLRDYSNQHPLMVVFPEFVFI